VPRSEMSIARPLLKPINGVWLQLTPRAGIRSNIYTSLFQPEKCGTSCGLFCAISKTVEVSGVTGMTKADLASPLAPRTQPAASPTPAPTDPRAGAGAPPSPTEWRALVDKARGGGVGVPLIYPWSQARESGTRSEIKESHFSGFRSGKGGI
jgi:hypothetical protein